MFKVFHADVTHPGNKNRTSKRLGPGEKNWKNMFSIYYNVCQLNDAFIPFVRFTTKLGVGWEEDINSSA